MLRRALLGAILRFVRQGCKAARLEARHEGLRGFPGLREREWSVELPSLFAPASRETSSSSAMQSCFIFRT